MRVWKAIRASLFIAVFLSVFFQPISVYASTPHATIYTEEIIYDDYNDEIHMTHKEALDYFFTFLSTRASTTSAENIYTTENLNTFIEFAVTNNIIDDSPEQRNSLQISTYRGRFEMVADTAYNLGYTTAATLLRRSLQDNPSDFIMGASSVYAVQIGNSTELSQIIDIFEGQILGTSKNTHTLSSSTTLNSTWDLKLAYNRVSYTATGYRGSGQWRVNTVIKDTYDFEQIPWSTALSGYDDLVIILNNFAADAQSIGAIVPFEIRITVSTTFET